MNMRTQFYFYMCLPEIKLANFKIDKIHRKHLIIDERLPLKNSAGEILK